MKWNEMDEMSVVKWWMKFEVGENGRNPEKNLPRPRFVYHETDMEWTKRELGIPAAVGGERLRVCHGAAWLYISYFRPIVNLLHVLYGKSEINSKLLIGPISVHSAKLIDPIVKIYEPYKNIFKKL